MIIKNYFEHEDGEREFDYDVNEEEADVLLRFAINHLIDTGWIDVNKQEDIEAEFSQFIDSGGTLQ